MKKITSKKNNFFLCLFIIFFLVFFFLSQKILFKKDFEVVNNEIKIVLIKILVSAEIFDITKFTTEDAPSFFNKKFKELIKTSPLLKKNSNKKPRKVYLNIDPKNYSIIKKNIIKSRKIDRIYDRRAFANANFISDNKKYFARIRLKGDFPHHWNRDERFSIKFNLKNKKKFNDLEEFSLQNFNTIFFPDAFVFSNIFNFYKVFTPKFDIIDLFVNGDHWGPIILKEYYNEDFFENRRSRNFQLFKFHDDSKSLYLQHLIQYKEKNINPGIINNIGHTGTNFFSIYNEDNIQTKSIISLFNSFIELINLRDANQYKNIKKFIDLDHYIKISSLNLLLGGDNHSVYSGNLRVFYNSFNERFYLVPTEPFPISKLDEKKIIDYNKFVNLTLDNKNKLFFLNNMISFINQFEINYNKNFKEEFSKNVCIYSYDNCEKKLIKIQSIIEGNILLSKKSIYEEIKKITESKKKNIKKYKNTSENKNYIKIKNYTNNYDLIKNHFYARIFDDRINLNYYFKPTLNLIDLTNLSTNQTFLINNNIKDKSNVLELDFLKNFKPGDQLILRYEFNNKKFSKKFILEDKYFNKLNFHNLKNINIKKNFIQEDGNTWIIKKGNWVIEEPIEIYNKNLLIEAGTKLEFEKDTYIKIEKGNFVSEGDKLNPIILKGVSNKYWNGIKIIDSKKTLIKNTNFHNIENFKNKISEITGAISFYNSSVEIKNCKFINSKAEDFINFVSSNFLFVESTIKNTISDGIDSDFSKGEIKNSSFSNIQGDGIDTSFSKVIANENYLEQISDKAFSIGENSFMEMNKSVINNTNIGIAIKDSSKLVGKQNIINNSNLLDITSYNKKNKFSQSITKLNLMQDNLKLNTTLDNIIIINGKENFNKVNNNKLNKQIYGF